MRARRHACPVVAPPAHVAAPAETEPSLCVLLRAENLYSFNALVGFVQKKERYPCPMFAADLTLNHNTRSAHATSAVDPNSAARSCAVCPSLQFLGRCLKLPG